MVNSASHSYPDGKMWKIIMKYMYRVESEVQEGTLCLQVFWERLRQSYEKKNWLTWKSAVWSCHLFMGMGQHMKKGGERVVHTWAVLIKSKARSINGETWDWCWETRDGRWGYPVVRTRCQWAQQEKYQERAKYGVRESGGYHKCWLLFHSGVDEADLWAGSDSGRRWNIM